MRRAIEPLARGEREAPLPGHIQGTTDFEAARQRWTLAPRARPRAALFRYPLSFLSIPTPSALPEIVKDRVFTRLREVLTGADESPDFVHLSAADRQAVHEILEATKDDFREIE